MPPLLDRQSQVKNWDEPLPSDKLPLWYRWLKGLSELNSIHVPRSVIPPGFGSVMFRELYMLSDASQDAISYTIYIRSINKTNQAHLSFFIGSSKVAPRSANSIPRLELCAALDAVTAAREVTEEFSLPFQAITYFTDSLMVLGYIQNRVTRFIRYVSRCIALILSMSQPDQ